MHIGVCVCKFKLFISDDKDNTIENVDLCLFLALHRHIVASLAARSSSGGVGGTFWFAAAPLFTGMVIGPFLGVVDGGPATCRMALLLFIPSVVGKCQQGCRQMPARLSANVYNLANKCQQPEIEVCEALGVVFPTSFGFRIMYQRSCSKPKTPFFFVEI